VGEIVIAALQITRGYWQRPDETKEMLRIDDRGERLLHTGDLGYLDADGDLFIVDCKKDLIKTSGYQVWPREIEKVMRFTARATWSERSLRPRRYPDELRYSTTTVPLIPGWR